MPRIFDKSKLKTDCANCDSVCCVVPSLPYAHYPKPPRVPCKHLDQSECRCTVFSELEKRGYSACRKFDCYGTGVVVAKLFRDLGRSWNTHPDTAIIQFHTFTIVYLTMLKYLHPDRAVEFDISEELIEKLKPLTEAALDMLVETADPFAAIKKP